MMQVTRQRVQTKALGGSCLGCFYLDPNSAATGLTLEDCRNAEKRLEEAGDSIRFTDLGASWLYRFSGCRSA